MEYSIKFWFDNEVVQEWVSTDQPMVPRRAELVFIEDEQGNTTKYKVLNIAYRYTNYTLIFVELEKA